ALRLAVRGDTVYPYVEYATSRWRAGGDNARRFPTARDPKTGRERPRGFPAGKVYEWSLEYDPKGDGGKGEIPATFGGETGGGATSGRGPEKTARPSTASACGP